MGQRPTSPTPSYRRSIAPHPPLDHGQPAPPLGLAGSVDMLSCKQIYIRNRTAKAFWTALLADGGIPFLTIHEKASNLSPNPLPQMTARPKATGKIAAAGKSPHLLLALLALSIALSAAFILRDSGTPMPLPMDQSFVSGADLRIGRTHGVWSFHYPNIMFSGGISSTLTAGLYKLIIPTHPDNVNWHIRIFAMAAYLISSAMLIFRFINASSLRILAFLVIATSSFQFIQPSSELFAGTFLTMFLYAYVSQWPLSIVSLLLALFGLAKVEFILASCLIAFYCWLLRYRQGVSNPSRITIYTLSWLFVFLAPSFFIQGSDPAMMDRSMVAFAFTYAELFYSHQFYGLPYSLDQSVEILYKGIFRESDSVLKFIINHPAKYFDFLCLSLGKGLFYLIQSLKFMLLPLAIIFVRPSKRLHLIIFVALIASICTLMPAWLFTYVRVRYFVKLYPILVVLATCTCEDNLALGKRAELLLWISGIGTIIWQLLYFNDMWLNSHFR